MLLQVIFVLCFHYICKASALQCRTCTKQIPLTVPNIDMNVSDCSLQDALHASCSQRLHIRYAKNETSIILGANPSETLILTNEARLMTNTTLIWLNRVQVERIFQIFCFNKSECDKNTINRTYVDVRNLEYAELWAHLVTRLYDSRSEPNKLTCTNDQDASVSCSEGFCQLISNDLLTFSRTCVPKGTMSNPYGIILESKTIPGKDIESSITYTCNRPMCNSLTMANEILHLLQIRELLSPIIVTTTTSTTTTESSSADMKKQLFYIPLIFVLIIMTIFA